MDMSPTLSKLALSLSLLNVELDNITRNKTAQVKTDKGSYSYTYADLASVLEKVRPQLLKLGLAVHQAPETCEGKVMVTTTVLHSSGEFISSSLTLPVSAQTAQGYGSAITYARRYALLGALGIATEDDDGALSPAAVEVRGEATPAAQPVPRALSPCHYSRYLSLVHVICHPTYLAISLKFKKTPSQCRLREFHSPEKTSCSSLTLTNNVI